MATLVTGGSGVIGAEVIRLLLERGEDRPGLFDLNPSPHRLGDMAERVDVVRGDLGTFSNVLDAVKRAKPTTIYHLGGMFSLPCEADPPAAVRVNALVWAPSTYLRRPGCSTCRRSSLPAAWPPTASAWGTADRRCHAAAPRLPLRRHETLRRASRALLPAQVWARLSGPPLPVGCRAGRDDARGRAVPLVGDRGQCQRQVLHDHGRAGDALPRHVRKGRRAGDRGAGRCPARPDPDGHLSPGWDGSRAQCRRTSGPGPDPHAWRPDRVPSRSGPPTTRGSDGSSRRRRQRAQRVGMAPCLRP